MWVQFVYLCMGVGVVPLFNMFMYIKIYSFYFFVHFVVLYSPYSTFYFLVVYKVL